MTGSCHVTAADAARALLGLVARGETVPIGALEEFVRVVLDAEPIVRLAMRVIDEREPRRLARAIELAGAVLDVDAAQDGAPATRAAGQAD